MQYRHIVNWPLLLGFVGARLLPLLLASVVCKATYSFPRFLGSVVCKATYSVHCSQASERLITLLLGSVGARLLPWFLGSIVCKATYSVPLLLGYVVCKATSCSYLCCVRGGGGGMVLQTFGPNNFFPKDFHTPNCRTDVGKRNKSIYYSNES